MSWNPEPKPTEPWQTLYMMAASRQRASTELLRGFVTHTHAHADTRVLHPPTRNLRLGTSVCAARPLAIWRSNRASESTEAGPTCRERLHRGKCAERSRMRSVWAHGPCRCHDVMLRKMLFPAHESPDRDGRPALWPMSTSGSRGVPTPPSSKLFARASAVPPSTTSCPGGPRTDPQYPPAL